MTSLLNGQTPEDLPPDLDPNKSYREELLAKYGDDEGIAKSKVYADNHIKILETRMDQLRGEYERVLAESKTAPKLQDLLDKLEKLEAPASREPNLNSNEDNRTVNETNNVDPSKLWEQFRTQEKQQENFNTVSQKAKETLGDNFKTVLKQRADSLGLRDEEVDAMARTNPNLFFKTFDIGPNQSNQQSFKAPPSSEVRQSNFAGQGEQKRTMSYYNELAKKNPRIYFDPKIAVQMDKDAQELGVAFFDV